MRVAAARGPRSAPGLDDADVESSPSSGPLARQRDRLDVTAIRLRARRDRAIEAAVPETTVRALDAHIGRIEQRLAALDAER